MSNPALANAAATGPGISGVWEVAAGLFVVVVAILAIGWFARRLYPGAVGGTRVLNVVAAMPLGPRERLLVVDAAGTQILIGVTAQQVTALHHFTEPLVLPDPVRGGDFALRLREAMSRGGRS